MFGYIKIAGMVLLASAIAGAYWYFTWSQAEIQVLRDNAVKMELALDLQKETITALKEDSKKVAKAVIKTNERYSKARKESKKLQKKLAKHNLGYLASKKAGLIQRRVNKGTADANRCIEILSGSELTELEKTTTLKSVANTSCSDIANPMYKEKR